MTLGAFATINTSSATIINNHKHARDGRRDDFDAKRDGRQDGHSYLTIGRTHILRSAHHIVLHILILLSPTTTPETPAGVKGWQPEPSLPSCRGERRCGGMTAKLNMFNYILFYNNYYIARVRDALRRHQRHCARSPLEDNCKARNSRFGARNNEIMLCNHYFMP